MGEQPSSLGMAQCVHASVLCLSQGAAGFPGPVPFSPWGLLFEGCIVIMSIRNMVAPRISSQGEGPHYVTYST